MAEAGHLGGPPAPLSHYNLKLLSMAPYDHRLEYARALQRLGKFL
jgi:hypothetical protein